MDVVVDVSPGAEGGEAGDQAGDQAAAAAAAEDGATGLTLPLRYSVEILLHETRKPGIFGTSGTRELRAGINIQGDASQFDAAIVSGFQRPLRDGRVTDQKLPAEACGVIGLMDTILAVDATETPTHEAADKAMKDAVAAFLRARTPARQCAVTLHLRSSFKTVPAWACARCTTINPVHVLQKHHATAGFVVRAVDRCEACMGHRGAP